MNKIKGGEVYNSDITYYWSSRTHQSRPSSNIYNDGNDGKGSSVDGAANDIGFIISANCIIASASYLHGKGLYRISI